MNLSLQAIESYDHSAADLCAGYQSLGTDSVHAAALDLFPRGAAVLDVGCGSGRDAAWLADRGNLVVAADASEGMLGEARRIHGEDRVIWVKDSLPRLSAIRGLNVWFDFILLSAVWMHVHPADRPEAIGALSSLLANGGKCVITLRHGTPDPKRVMHPVSADEVRHLAAHAGLRVIREVPNADLMRRADVRWTTVVIGA